MAYSRMLSQKEADAIRARDDDFNVVDHCRAFYPRCPGVLVKLSPAEQRETEVRGEKSFWVSKAPAVFRFPVATDKKLPTFKIFVKWQKSLHPTDVNAVLRVIPVCAVDPDDSSLSRWPYRPCYNRDRSKPLRLEGSSIKFKISKEELQFRRGDECNPLNQFMTKSLRFRELTFKDASEGPLQLLFILGVETHSGHVEDVYAVLHTVPTVAIRPPVARAYTRALQMLGWIVPDSAEYETGDLHAKLDEAVRANTEHDDSSSVHSPVAIGWRDSLMEPSSPSSDSFSPRAAVHDANWPTAQERSALGSGLKHSLPPPAAGWPVSSTNTNCTTASQPVLQWLLEPSSAQPAHGRSRFNRLRTGASK